MRCAGRVRGAQVFPGGVEAARGRVDQGRVVGVGDGIKIIRSQPALGQAPGDRLLRQFPGGERDRALAVLAPAEALLLGCGDRTPSTTRAAAES